MVFADSCISQTSLMEDAVDIDPRPSRKIALELLTDAARGDGDPQGILNPWPLRRRY